MQVRANGMAEHEVPNSSALSDEGRAAPHLEVETAEPAAPPPCSTADVQRAASLLNALVSATEGLPVEAITVSILFYRARPLDVRAVVHWIHCKAPLRRRS